MRTNIKMILVSLVIAVLISGNALAEQECGFHGQREKGSKAKEMITSELNLSVDQQNRLEQEKVAHREVMEKMRGALKEKRAELRDAIAKPGTTKEQVEPILAQIKKLQADMADKRMDGIFAVKGILSPEQFTKLQAMKEKKMQAGKVSLAR